MGARAQLGREPALERHVATGEDRAGPGALGVDEVHQQHAPAQRLGGERLAELIDQRELRRRLAQRGECVEPALAGGSALG